MLEIDPGHAFVVEIYDGDPNMTPRFIRFMKRIGAGNAPPATSGTNCQELLRVLIRRVMYLNDQKPNAHNHIILNNLRNSLWHFELRAAERRDDLAGFRDRAGEWAVVPIDGDRPLCIEQAPACPVCGHIFCAVHP